MRYETFTCFTCDAVRVNPTPDRPRRYCDQQCYHAGSARRLAPRFWSKVDKSGECWVFTGRLDQHGYGIFAVVGSGSHGAHRWSWFLAHGEIPKGLGVLHRCDNPPCVNPAHLFLGTQFDNLHDAAAKGRLRFAEHLNKLTPEQKADVRLRYQRGSAARLAAEFSVSKATICRIAAGEVR